MKKNKTNLLNKTTKRYLFDDPFPPRTKKKSQNPCKLPQNPRLNGDTKHRTVRPLGASAGPADGGWSVQGGVCAAGRRRAPRQRDRRGTTDGGQPVLGEGKQRETKNLV